jgi:hypothetical protein
MDRMKISECIVNILRAIFTSELIIQNFFSASLTPWKSNGFLALTQEQCDQKFRHLGYFLLNQFSPKQAVSTHGLLKGFKSS